MSRVWIATLLLAAVVAADDIYAKRGGTPLARDVKVTKEEGGNVFYLDKSLKERKFPKAITGRIAKKRCDIHEYFDRSEAAKDADAVVAIAVWANEKKFRPHVVSALYERALTLDKNNEAANLALGHVQYKGEWMTPAEREERMAGDEAEAMKAKGLVRWEKQWVTPEDKAKLDKGLRKYEGQWMTPDEIKEAQGFVKFNGKWIRRDELEVMKLMGSAKKDTGLGDRLKLAQTPHFAVMGDLPVAKLQDLAKTMEKLYAEWVRIFPDSKEMDLLPGKYRLFAFKKSRPYQSLVRARFQQAKNSGEHSKRWLAVEDKRTKLRLRETSTWYLQPDIASVHVQMPDPFEALRAHCVHFAANVLATRYSRLRFPTWWMNEGIAYYFEKKVTGTIQTFSIDVGMAKYADQGPGEDAKPPPWLDSDKWNSLLIGLVRGGRDPKLDKMKSKNLFEAKNRLRAQDVAKAHSVVTFLIRTDAKKFAAFYRDCKDGVGKEVEREVAAVIKHYGSYRKLEDRWKQYALNGFKIAR